MWKQGYYCSAAACLVPGPMKCNRREISFKDYLPEMQIGDRDSCSWEEMLSKLGNISKLVIVS